MGRRSFDRVGNLAKTIDRASRFINEWREDHVHMVWHDDSDVNIDFHSMSGRVQRR